MTAKDLDLISKLPPEERRHDEFAMEMSSPDDSKYIKSALKLKDF